MGSMELFLLGVLAGWIPPTIIVVVMARRAWSMGQINAAWRCPKNYLN